MSFFDKQHEKESPIGKIRAHIGTFFYFVDLGKSRFKNKGRVGDIFEDMENTKYLFRQATSGTIYDFKKKLDYTLWDAAVHKYTEDLAELKKELLKAVDEGALDKKKTPEPDEEEEKEEKPKKTGDWKADLKGEMAEAEEEKKRAAERRKEEELEREKKLMEAPSEKLDEADCRELWRIMQGLEREYDEMNHLAEEWFAIHGKGEGCLGALVMMTLLPAGAIYGIWHLF